MKKKYTFFIFLIAFLSTFVKVRSFDLFFYLKIAEIESFFNTLKSNFFSFSHPDFPYQNYSFLFSELAYFFSSNFGISSLIILQSFAISISYVILIKSVDYKKSVITLFIIFLLSVFTLRYRLLFRPHNLSYLFFTINLFLLTRVPKNYLVYLLLNQILWVNTHNGFILGIINLFLLYPYLKERINFGKSLFILLIGSLISPSFYKPFLEIVNPFLGMTKDIFQYIKVHEWQPVDDRLYFSFYGILVVVGFLILIKEKKWFLLPFYVFYLVISIRFVRFVDFFALASLYTVIQPISKYEQISFNYSIKFKKLFGFSKIFFLIIISLFSIKDYFNNHLIPYGYGMADYFYPSSAVNYIKQKGIKGNIFNTYAFGGYIIYYLYPECKPIIDGRLCYPLEFIKLYADSHENEKSFIDIVAKYKPDIFFVDFEHPQLAQFITKLRDSYALVYFDDIAMIFLDRKKFEKIVSDDEFKFLKPLYVSGYSEGEENIKGVKLELENVLKTTPNNRSKVMYGNILLAEGDVITAQKFFENVIKSRIPIGKAEAYNNLGVIKLSEGKLEKAKSFFKRALSLDKNQPFAHINLAQIYDTENKYFFAYYHYKMFLKNSGRDIPDEIKERVKFLSKYVLFQSARFLIIILASSGIFIIILRRIKLNKQRNY